PRWTNAAARGSLLALAVLAIGIPTALMVWVRTSYATGEHAVVTQPVPFDHRVHTHALRIDCRHCHFTAEVAPSAGLPPTAACIGCHNSALLNSATFAPVRASIASQKPIEWRRVNALPDFVFFNHSIHLAKGIGCESCHGRVDQMGQVSQATTLSMGWCLDCHRDPVRHVRPRSEVTAMGWDATHVGPATDSLRRRLAHDYNVRSFTNCTTCHR
ncbi:MAG TPA: cytochrome c3 family protein, partial [Gemmatimonadaceae bacterium]